MLLPQDRPKPKPCAGCPDRTNTPIPRAGMVPPQPAGPTVDINPAEATPPRTSCLECVEKHIGAAWVLFSEYQDGYPYRILIIGHMHEAEEESRKWPELFGVIRESRKDFQQSGRTPDFAFISLKIKETRDKENKAYG